MKASRLIQSELKLIDGLYFAVYNPHISDRKSMSCGKGRWQVRKWIGVIPKRLGLWDCGYSEVIYTICKEEMTDLGLVDTGYRPMDMRAITDIRESDWFLDNWEREIAEMDWRNEKRIRFEGTELDYQSKYYAKKIYRIRNEPTINLSGKEWRI